MQQLCAQQSDEYRVENIPTVVGSSAAGVGRPLIGSFCTRMFNMNFSVKVTDCTGIIYFYPSYSKAMIVDPYSLLGNMQCRMLPAIGEFSAIRINVAQPIIF